MSGGVDSSVTAALLLEQGALVHGVFIKGWYPPMLPCTWRADRNDAMRVAAKLNIPFQTLDASREYKEHVIEYLISEYKAGRTPNPDIMCNKYVKFGAFYEYARAQGADFVATGHYAQIQDGVLLRGADSAKDQSYFLWDIDPKALAHLLFPIGSYQKAQVRALAQKYDLPTAAKHDSQGICFLGSVSIDEFLASEFSLVAGTVLNTEGENIGTHSGAAAYTLGERVPIAGSSEPWYVVAKDMERNEVIASRNVSSEAGTKRILLSDLNTFGDIDSTRTYSAQYRYHGPLIEGKLDTRTRAFDVTTSIEEPLAEGQSLVLYDGARLVAGGIIDECR